MSPLLYQLSYAAVAFNPTLAAHRRFDNRGRQHPGWPYGVAPDQLATRTEVGTSLSNDDPPNARTAGWTRLTGPGVRPELILHVAAGIDPVDRGPIGGDAGQQCGSDCAVQSNDLSARQVTAVAARMKAGAVQRLVRIDIAKPGDHGLVQQERLEHPR